MTELECCLTSTELNRFSEAIFDLSQGGSHRSKRETIARAMFDLTGAERLASYRWDTKAQRYHKPLLINLNPVHGQHYLDVLQFNDPITPRMRQQTAATRIEDVLPLQDFERLEFYNEFLRPDDMYHGVNVFLRTGRDVVCDFRIFRGRSSPAFSRRELLLIDAMSACLVKAMGQSDTSDLDVLTEREREIANLVSHGCTDADIERILKISFSTVRTHMGRCFSKLGCSNRSELAAFISQRRSY